MTGSWCLGFRMGGMDGWHGNNSIHIFPTGVTLFSLILFHFVSFLIFLFQMYIKFKGDIATCFSFYNLIVDPALGRKSSAGSNIC